MKWNLTSETPMPTPKVFKEGEKYTQQVSCDLICVDDEGTFLLNFGFDVDDEETLSKIGVRYWTRVDEISSPNRPTNDCIDRAKHRQDVIEAWEAGALKIIGETTLGGFEEDDAENYYNEKFK